MKYPSHELLVVGGGLAGTRAVIEAGRLGVNIGWISKINREVGRKGCQHFAEILVECGRCLDQARMSQAVVETLKSHPSASTQEIARSWTQSHPEAQGSCLARPKG